MSRTLSICFFLIIISVVDISKYQLLINTYKDVMSIIKGGRVDFDYILSCFV